MILRHLWNGKSKVISWLLFVAFFLIIAVLIKDGVITNARLAENKDFFDALSKITTTLILIIGAVLSYIRFFRGRTLKPKLILKPTSGAISLDGGLLHWIEIQVENTGSISIWNYRIKVYTTYHGPLVSHDEIKEFVCRPPDLDAQAHVVDAGESSFEHAFVLVPPHVRAVTFQVVLIDHNETMWTRCLTAKNSEPREL